MTTPTTDINRLAPILWVAAGSMFFLAAWLGDSIAFAGVGLMFVMLGLAAYLKNRKQKAK